ncbi:MAG: indole-3-glycerol phosphate synthase TrpC [Gammaproteobacteria bacterium]|nr:MAG: indole-3-glycerol phosphate synthase TrpC [Gammaproteobacteria bacterium]
MTDTPTILKKIIDRKFEEVAAREKRLPLAVLKDNLVRAPKPRGFARAIADRLHDEQPAVIAEIKKASPSKGIIREDFDPPAIARSYEAGGAACLSVLTDIDFFQGDDSYLIAARNACNLPVLRKDFIVSEYQIYESRMIGADCILLIAAALDSDTMTRFCDLARELGMDVLVEVHNAKEMEAALPLNTPLLGINNRDLHTFNVDLNTTIELIPDIPAGKIIVTESGIHTRDDIELMLRHEVHTFLVGESFMRAEDPGAQLRAVFFPEG